MVSKSVTEITQSGVQCFFQWIRRRRRVLENLLFLEIRLLLLLVMLRLLKIQLLLILLLVLMAEEGRN